VAKLELTRIVSPKGCSRVAFIATASYGIQVQVASGLSWICASFRCSPNVDIMLSSTLFESQTLLSGQKQFKLPPSDLRKNATADSSETPCWHPLFPYRVIAHGFPIRSRKEGRGLELSFENMIAASRCLSFVEYNKGLIAHGLTSILIPIRDLVEDDAI
jgi:hypothetical protein